MKTTDTALLGHLEEEGTLYLSAVAVADLWTSSTGVFIQVRSGRVRSGVLKSFLRAECWVHLWATLLGRASLRWPGSGPR